MLRTHTCGELKKEHIGKTARLCGWVGARRDHGSIIFIDLRDGYGITQIVFNPQENKPLHRQAETLRGEFVVAVSGGVRRRPEGMVNPKLPTGEIELVVTALEILNTSLTPPFEVLEDTTVTEELRLKYRYLDLRRAAMQKNLRLRHRVTKIIRDILDGEHFVEIETPILTKSTPEGARDYLVPSRVNPGNFYALPQSPQLFKQLLMVASLDRYFQITKCFRDEDLRADRQPEFTQLDMELSFADEEDIFGISERLLARLFKEILGEKLAFPFPRIPYAEAMARFGTDKPDTRFAMELVEMTAAFKDCAFKIFQSAIKKGGKVLALAAKGAGSYSRGRIDELAAFVGDYGAKGLAYFKVGGNGLSSPISKFFSKEELALLTEETSAVTGDMIFLIADADGRIAYESIGALRIHLAEEMKVKRTGKFNFLWVTGFPLFKFNKEESRWESEHHPFTECHCDDRALLQKKEQLQAIRARSYDLVVNGVELGSGSIRIHRRELQEKIFRIIGIHQDEARKRFGFLLEAFKYGAPPHGGIAFGLDRLLTLLLGTESIRDVIAFPKTQKAFCPLTGAPSAVNAKQLDELGLKVKK